jgi:hypothetical protein
MSLTIRRRPRNDEVVPINYEIITRQPEGEARPVPLLFVHGAWHAAWCWEPHFLPYFAEQGYACYALSLRGHGGTPNDRSLRLTGAWHYVADVARVADQIAGETGARPAVIGHSMGGYITQKYLERHDAPAAVLLASIPRVGTFPYQMRTLIRFPLPALKLALTLSAYPLVATPELAHRHFFSDDMPSEQVAAYQAKMQDEAIRILWDAGFAHRPRPKHIRPTPMLVLAAENDRVFTLAEEKATAKAYGAEAIILPDTAHDVMLEPRWREGAEKIAEWLREQGM